MIERLVATRKRKPFWQKPKRRKALRTIRYKNCKVSIVNGSSSVETLGTEVYRTSTEYDSRGKVKSSTDANGNTMTYEYDKLDRQIKTMQANGLITETVYNAKGQVEKSIVKSGSDVRTTQYKYDVFGNVCETIQPDGTSISAAYNNKGQKVSETNQLGQTRYFEYDANGQLVNVTLLDESRETFEYDVRGRLSAQTSFEGVVTTYQYDALDRMASKTFTQNGVLETWSYTYDEFGHVTKTDQNGRITETKYTPQGQVEKILTPEGTITYTYDAFGRQTSVQADDDAPVEYSYDNFGRLNQVKSGSETTCYEYDAFGNLVLTTTKTGTQTIAVTYEYDKMNRLTKLTNYVDQNQDNILVDNERVSQFDYVLDWLGRKDNAVETFWSQYGEQKNLVDGSVKE